jgi:hypothetical protein
MDLFNKFNSLHLLPREDSHLTDHPLEVAKGLLDFKHPKLKTGGSFNSPACEYLRLLCIVIVHVSVCLYVCLPVCTCLSVR